MGRAEEDLHDELLGRVARRYFVDGMLQNDIAAAEHLSRPSVSRLLTEARARGVVQFRIGPPVDRVRALETQLRRQTGLRRCVVATSKPRALYGTSGRLGYVAARYLESQLAATRLLGVASSRSLSSVVDSLAAAHRPDLTVIDLLGCPLGSRPGGAGNAGEGGRLADGSGPNTAQLIATRLGASFRPLAAPFVYRSATALDAALDSEPVRETLALGQRCEVALVVASDQCSVSMAPASTVLSLPRNLPGLSSMVLWAICADAFSGWTVRRLNPASRRWCWELGPTNCRASPNESP